MNENTHEQVITMKPCFVETIAELEDRILGIQALIAGIKRYGGGGVTKPALIVERVAPVPIVQLAGQARRNGGEKQPAKSKLGTRASALDRVQELLGIAACLPEPITPEALQKAAGIKKLSLANGALWRWEKRKWVTRIARGEYRRSRQFPVNAAANSEAKDDRIQIPGLDSGSVSDRLDQAKGELAEAISNGKSTLANILRDKIEKLTKELATA